MIITNLFFLLAHIVVFSSAEMLDVCSDSCVQQNCVGKLFILTPAKTTFDKARGMCLSLGGDVVQEVLSECGKKYHSQIQTITKTAFDSGFGDIYVGVTDTYEESTDANCVVTNGVNYYDVGCSFSYYGLCEIERSLC